MGKHPCGDGNRALWMAADETNHEADQLEGEPLFATPLAAAGRRGGRA
jgi:hypothetical protein